MREDSDRHPRRAHTKHSPGPYKCSGANFDPIKDLLLLSREKPSLGKSLRELELLALLLDKLDEVLVDVGEVLAVLLLYLVLLLAAGALLGHHDDARGPLGAARGAELRARGHEDVRHVDVLAQHRDVADHVHRADVAREHYDAWERGVARPGGGGLAEGLDDFFYAALKGLVFGSCRRGGFGVSALQFLGLVDLLDHSLLGDGEGREGK